MTSDLALSIKGEGEVEKRGGGVDGTRDSQQRQGHQKEGKMERWVKSKRHELEEKRSFCFSVNTSSKNEYICNTL